ncbi:MAG: hypothetical protein HZB24_07000, partial [Desulfobacterales bacterium]|nr:hypothetical protein [Desulfobacterales bacterium]
MPPIARTPRTEPGEIRRRLKIPEGAPMVLLSMGGVPDQFQFLSRLPERIDAYIVIPGANNMSSPHPKVILLPTHSGYFHPDLLQAADLLIGKAGYSTIAEALAISARTNNANETSLQSNLGAPASPSAFPAVRSCEDSSPPVLGAVGSRSAVATCAPASPRARLRSQQSVEPSSSAMHSTSRRSVTHATDSARKGCTANSIAAIPAPTTSGSE